MRPRPRAAQRAQEVEAVVVGEGGWRDAAPSSTSSLRAAPATDVPLGGVPWGPGIFDLRLLLVLAVVSAVVALVLLVRRVLLAGALGAFECLLRELPGERAEGEGAAGPWRSGVARYEGDQLQWFAALAFGRRPALVLERHVLDLVGRRDGRSESIGRSIATPVVLTLRYGSQLLELAVAARYAAALTLWAESGPPGRGLDVA